MSNHPDTRTNRLVVFTLGDWRYGLPLFAVDRIVRVVDVTSLPKAPDIVLGVVNVRGRVIPVINVRRRFRLPEREIALSDQMLIARTTRRPVALMVDAVTGVLHYSEQEAVAAEDVLPELQYVDGLVKLDDGLILIHNLDTFLSLEEEAVLDRALENDS
ncbi:MAG: chemotaxis protein CheW [Thermoanaerobaculia bacterium]